MIFVKFMDMLEDEEYFLKLTEDQYRVFEWLKDNCMLDLDTTDFEITDNREETFIKI